MNILKLLSHQYFVFIEKLNKKFTQVPGGPVWRSGEFEWMRELERHTDVILQEYREYLAQGRIVPEIHEIDPDAYKSVGNNDWEMLHLYLMGSPIEEVCKQFPKTLQVLSHIPGFCHVKFSILPAERHSVPRHRDAFNGVLRTHLALKVPSEGNCYLEVDGESVEWQRGKCFVFDPGSQHSVVKEAKQERVILIVDFHRPLPNWLSNLSKNLYTNLSVLSKPVLLKCNEVARNRSNRA
ncbi:aspartyl/asparaginyl beta-hydroxylase domain-containing protein [Pseudoalteromonas piscicida]|uniref:aspartyl/asparaginyl beta-hydroxylase domain-containing protein n=1 Tax=Pseudoalteromonas piscicida TaxID=43662 RepID=UPI0030B1CAA3